MYINRNTKIMLSACAFLYLLAGAFRVIDLNVENMPVRLAAISYLAHCVLCILTLIYVRRDIPNTHSRRNLMIAVWVLFIWQIVGMLKDVLYPVEFAINRWFWYSYYIAMLFIPVFLLLAAQNTGLHDSQKINPMWYTTLAISGILSIGVMTNDRHELAFPFIDGPQSYYIGHGYGPLFFAVMVWIFAVFAMIFVTLWNRIKVEKTRTYIWVVFVSIGLGGLYLVWRITNYRVIPWLNDMYDIPQIWEAIVILAIEFSIRLSIIRANYNFLEFYTASTLSSSLVDADGTVRYQTSGIITTTTEQRLESLEHNVYLDRDHRLSGRYIEGGYAFWVDDLSRFNELGQQLGEIQEHLKEENNLIKAENEIMSRRVKADERNKLYDLMARSVGTELDVIENLIKNSSPEDPDFNDKLSEACIYKAYIKRFCNMMLLSQDRAELSSFELENSIRESMQYITINGIQCDILKFGEGYYPADELLLMYAIFERVVTNSEGLESLIVEISANDRAIRLNIHIEGENLKFSDESLTEFDSEIAKYAGNKRIRTESSQENPETTIKTVKTVRIDLPKVSQKNTTSELTGLENIPDIVPIKSVQEGGAA